MIKRNNPGNIRSFIDQNGNTSKPFYGELAPDIKPGNKSGFRVFDSLSSGYRALFRLLKTGYINRGLNTIEKIFPVYAPSSDDNNPNGYIASVEKMTGIPRDKILSTYAELIPIVKAITTVEHGETANNTAVKQGYDSIDNPGVLVKEIITTEPGAKPGKKKIIIPILIGAGILTTIYLVKNAKQK